MTLVWVTTLDNPFNPFTEFDKWKEQDEELGYDTCSKLDRINGSTFELSNELNNIVLESSIDSMIRSFPFIDYIKVKESDSKVFEILANANK